MVRLILISAAVFLALYLLSRRFNTSQNSNEAEDDVVGSRSGGFLILVIAVVIILSVIFILPRLGVSLGGLLQKAVAFVPIIRAYLPF
jgi:heme/copper-type cytochrome/quinol oxidase subunit 2